MIFGLFAWHFVTGFRCCHSYNFHKTHRKIFVMESVFRSRRPAWSYPKLLRSATLPKICLHSSCFPVPFRKFLEHLFYRIHLKQLPLKFLSSFQHSEICKGHLISILDQFQSGFAYHTETSHWFCSAKQMTGFDIKCNTGLKCFNVLKF